MICVVVIGDFTVLVIICVVLFNFVISFVGLLVVIISCCCCDGLVSRIRIINLNSHTKKRKKNRYAQNAN